MDTNVKGITLFYTYDFDISVIHDIILKNCDKSTLEEYIKISTSFINEYNELARGSTKNKISLRKSKEDSDIIDKRIKLIHLNVSKRNNLTVGCNNCNAPKEEIDNDNETGLSTCSKCGYENEILTNKSIYRDYSRVGGSKNNYNDWENFERAINRYQGKQKNRPPIKLYEQLDIYFSTRNKTKHRSIIKTLPCYYLPITKEGYKSCGKKKGTSRELMLQALCDTSNPKYYDDVNLIMSVYWEWELPSIPEVLMEQIKKDYHDTQEVYYTIEKKRDASLNTQWRLYSHLKARNWPCEIQDFKIQNSRESLMEHQDWWKIMCDKAKVPYYPVI